MTARKIWNGACESGNLPPEWRTWAEFRAWVNANGYKAEYGYKGEFTPDSLLKAIPNKKGADKTAVTSDFNSLMKLKLDELKQIALESKIDVGEASTKREIATLICGGK